MLDDLKLYQLFLVIVVALTACKPRITHVDSSAAKDDSGITRAPYEEIVGSLKLVYAANTDYMSIFESINDTNSGADSSGLTSQGRSILGVRLGQPDDPTITYDTRPVVYLVEAIHGNEYLDLADRMVDAFLKAKDGDGGIARYFNNGGIILIVPIANPDGYALGQRRNAVLLDPNDPNQYGHDLNRDFADPYYDALVDERPDLNLATDVHPKIGPNFTQVESRFLRNFLKSEMDQGNRKLFLTNGHHCCCDWLGYPWLYFKGVANPALSDTEKQDYDAIGALYKQYVNPTALGNGSKPLLGTMDRYFDAVYPGAYQLTFEGAFPVQNSTGASATCDLEEQVVTNSTGRTADDVSKLVDLDSHMAIWDKMLGQIADGTFVHDWTEQPDGK